MVPAPLVRDRVPDEFELVGPAADGVDLRLQALDCARTTTALRLLGGGSQFLLEAHVRPRDPSWSDGDHEDYYVLAFLLTDPATVDGVQAFGVPAERAALQEGVTVPSLESSRRTFTSDRHAMTVSYSATAVAPGQHLGRSYLWASSDAGFRRVDGLIVWSATQEIPWGTFRVSDGASALPQAMVRWSGDGVSETDVIWFGDERLFQA